MSKTHNQENIVVHAHNHTDGNQSQIHNNKSVNHDKVDHTTGTDSRYKAGHSARYKIGDKWVKLFSNAIHIIILVVLTAFVSLNVIFSQIAVHPDYFRFINEDEKASFVFINTFRSKPEGNFIRQNLSQTEKVLQKDIEKFDKDKQETISRLEALLEKNSKSRDVLYMLSIMHRQNGEIEKADDYMKKVKEIDPAEMPR